MNLTSSPSRTYVALSLKGDGGYLFTKFELPPNVWNDSEMAAYWFSRNVEDSLSIVQGAVTFEEYSNLHVLKQKRRK